jgi:integrase
MRYYKVLEEGGLRSVSFHTLRHTFATRCIEGGMDVKTLSEILGHSSVKMTLERYVHSTMDFKKEQINKVYDNIQF